jgi:coenzyme Q-binding protein COQ10
MPQFSNKRRVAHTADQMFDLVADVERYPEFVPLCAALKVRQRNVKPDGTETLISDMTVSFKLFKETFTSRVTLDRANRKILVEYVNGPFSSLENRWSFEPKGDGKADCGCEVTFFIAYEFKSRMLAMLVGSMFDTTFARLSAAFEKRADAIYGKKPAVSS